MHDDASHLFSLNLKQDLTVGVLLVFTFTF